MDLNNNAPTITEICINSTQLYSHIKSVFNRLNSPAIETTETELAIQFFQNSL